ncbi:MAG: cell division protein FtsZ [Chloroflexi bacterium]|nr:cell division protein FtsZ [Chloroflexota bacterium]
MAKANTIPNPVVVKVIGLGGGGCNAVSRMVKQNIPGIEFIAMNTDAQALELVEAPTRVQLGDKLTRGLGVGGDHNLGQKAAEENRDEIKELLTGADMVFLAAGMGGGTGTGTAPVVAEVAKHLGALTVAIVTKPFTFEGMHRRRVAEEGLARLISKVDTLVTVPNDRLFALCDEKTGVDAAFKMADDVLAHGVLAVSEVVAVPGVINLDFADVRSVMKDSGLAWLSIGIGTGKNRAVEAAKSAISSPLLEGSIDGARGVMFNVVGSDSLTLFEVNEAAEIIKRAVDPDANIIFGVAHNPSMEGQVHITLIATGFGARTEKKQFNQNDEVAQFLRELKAEEELDAPSFMRKPQFNQRRQMGTPVTRTIKAHPGVPVHPEAD